MELRHVLVGLGYTNDLADEAQIAAAVEAACGLATIESGMRNDQWAKHNRERRQRRKTREDAERRDQELKEAWRRRHMGGEPEERRLERDRRGLSA